MTYEILDVKENIMDEEILDVLSPSIFIPTPERLRSRAESYKRNDKANVYAYRKNEKYLGVVVFELKGDEATVLDIAVEAAYQSKGIGSCLIDLIFREFRVARVYAETDDDAIGFYKKYGFIISKTYIKSDTVRYICVCKNTVFHYNSLINENNDPVHDPKPLRDYMDKWDGPEFIDKMCLDENKSVLEVGVGTGRLAIRVAPLCGEFCGIDISPKTIERAQENLAGLRNISLICGDFLSYGFDRSFDVIYSSLTLMHMEDKQRAIDKIAGLLTCEGRLVLSIDKNPSEYIDTGERKIKVYPDKSDATAGYIKTAGLTILDQYDTEFATVFVAQKG